jgi:23S rRNA (uracil1939-C5)-methyltransferase
VAVPHINAVLRGIAEFGSSVRGKISSLLLEADEDGVVAVLKSPYALASSEARSIIELAKKYFPSALLFAGEKEIGGFGRQILELPLNERGTLTLRVPAGYFSQVNAAINARLVSKAVEIANPAKGETIYDLYAGAGNFALPFARSGADVTAVECDKRLIAVGRENAARYNLQKNLEFIDSSVEKFLDRRRPPAAPDLIIADPPRSGLGSLASALGEAQRLIVVSCHLPSFVRDAKNLSDNGWAADTIIPFDMFAQTSYVEILSLFNRT